MSKVTGAFMGTSVSPHDRPTQPAAGGPPVRSLQSRDGRARGGWPSWTKCRRPTMSHLHQWLNGYALLWFPAAVATGAAVLLITRRSRVRWWALWVVAVVGTGQGAALLRSADGTVIES